MKLELDVREHCILVDKLWELYRARAREAVALFCAAEWLEGPSRREVRDWALNTVQSAAETRSIWDKLSQM